MLDILSLVVPFFAVIGCGYAGARLIGDQGQRGLNNFVLYFALPALLFSMMARSDIAVRFEWDFIKAYTSVSLLLFFLTFAVARTWLRQRRRSLSIHAMSAVYGNTGYMGIPMVVILLGQGASVPVVMSLIIDLAVMVPLTAALIESDSSNPERNLWHGALGAFLATLKNPLIIASAAGAAWSLLGWPLPAMTGGFLDLIGAAAAPCALFAMGCGLYGKPLGGAISPALMVSVLKLIGHPVLLFLVGTWVWSVDPGWLKPALIASSLPVAVTVYVVARQYETEVAGASTNILVSTALSLVSLPLLLGLVDDLPGL